eukprot:jgi/Mesvir1/8973/Mv14195-RA.2
MRERDSGRVRDRSLSMSGGPLPSVSRRSSEDPFRPLSVQGPAQDISPARVRRLAEAAKYRSSPPVTSAVAVPPRESRASSHRLSRQSEIPSLAPRRSTAFLGSQRHSSSLGSPLSCGFQEEDELQGLSPEDAEWLAAYHGGLGKRVANMLEPTFQRHTVDIPLDEALEDETANKWTELGALFDEEEERDRQAALQRKKEMAAARTKEVGHGSLTPQLRKPGHHHRHGSKSLPEPTSFDNEDSDREPSGEGPVPPRRGQDLPSVAGGRAGEGADVGREGADGGAGGRVSALGREDAPGKGYVSNADKRYRRRPTFLDMARQSPLPTQGPKQTPAEAVVERLQRLFEAPAGEGGGGAKRDTMGLSGPLAGLADSDDFVQSDRMLGQALGGPLVRTAATSGAPISKFQESKGFIFAQLRRAVVPPLRDLDHTSISMEWDFAGHRRWTLLKRLKMVMQRADSGPQEAADLFEMAALLCHLCAFVRDLPVPKVLLLCEVVKLEVHYKSKVVIRQGPLEAEPRFYMIISGRVQVKVQCFQTREIQTVAVLSIGDCFGEAALMEGANSERSASVVCSTNCEFLSISHEDFRRIVAYRFRSDCAKKVGFLKRSPAFQGCSSIVLWELAPFLRAQQLKAGHFLHPDTDGRVFILLRGECYLRGAEPSDADKLLASAESNTTAGDRQRNQRSFEGLPGSDDGKLQMILQMQAAEAADDDPAHDEGSQAALDQRFKSSLKGLFNQEAAKLRETANMITRHHRKHPGAVITHLTPGSSFGLTSVYKDLARKWYVETLTDVELLSISKAHFLNRMPPEVIKKLLEELAFKIHYYDGRHSGYEGRQILHKNEVEASLLLPPATQPSGGAAGPAARVAVLPARRA